MATIPPIPDLVRVSKLDTDFSSNPEYTQHVQYVSESASRRRRVRKEERWKKERRLGSGSFGVVWLEKCIQGDGKGKLRAVKIVQKLEDNNYHRELEAIALFSHSKYEQCFVKSFGWYDDDDSVFITMEYLPYGDLHKYLTSPLPEDEAQNIVSQVLEGLKFMHQNGFAHRDLKPANLLVVCKRPDWWVKIADFGISKRTVEELTALRTLTGTPAFAAPEVFGFIQSDSYTNAVDIWSLGVIAFLILTGETLFKDPRRLARYVAGSFKFPSDVLLANRVSDQGRDFIRSLMAPTPEDRPGAEKSLLYPWLANLTESTASETQRKINASELPETLPYYSDAEASASWSSVKQSLPYILQRPTDQLAGYVDSDSSVLLSPRDEYLGLDPNSKEKVLSPRLSTSQPRTQVLKAPSMLKGHNGPVWCVAFSPNGKLVASGSQDSTVRLWDPATGTARVRKGHNGIVWDIEFSPDGKLVASGSDDNTVRLWDTATGMTRVLQGHKGQVWDIEFSPNGKLIASGSDDNTVRLWDLATGMARVLKGHKGTVFAIAFSSDGKLIASASKDGTVRLWDTATGTARVLKGHKGHKGQVWDIEFSPDGKLIAFGTDDNTVRLWDTATGMARELKGHKGIVWDIAVSPDGKLIASGSDDNTVRLWDLATGTAHVLKGHNGPVRCIAFSPNGKLIASGSDDNTVRLWESGVASNSIVKT